MKSCLDDLRRTIIYACPECEKICSEDRYELREQLSEKSFVDRVIESAKEQDVDITNPAALVAFMKGDVENAKVASTPGGIEAQEAQGQKDLVSAETTRLPIRGSEVYESMGIKVLELHDDLFVNVTLPDGWKLEATDHSMHSKLLDDKGRERGGVFYKAAFYDRKADFSPRTRFRVTSEPEDAYESDISYEERQKMKTYGRVYDGDKIIFETEGQHLADVTNDWDIQQAMRDEAKAWLIAQGYEHYEGPGMYWD